MFRFLSTTCLLLISIGFIGYSLHGDMRSDGIATVPVNIPFLNSRLARFVGYLGADELGSKLKSKVSEAAGRETGIEIPSKADDFVSGIATRVSELTAEATEVLDTLSKAEALKVTLGTDRICHITGSDSKHCQAFPAKISDWFPEPIDELIDIDAVFPTALLSINIRICLVFALLGSLVLAVAFIVPFFLGLPLLQVMPFLRLVVEVAIFLLAIIPLLTAAVITFVIPSVLGKVDALEVAIGNLVWSLGAALATMTLSGILFFKNCCR